MTPEQKKGIEDLLRKNTDQRIKDRKIEKRVMPIIWTVMVSVVILICFVLTYM